MTTRKEYTGTRDLQFSQWIRDQLPDSSTGFMVSDLDFILYNYKSKDIMLLEVKTRGSDCKTWQKKLWYNLHNWIKKGISEDWNYHGFHLITFENTNFDDGKVYLDHKEITVENLRYFLSFEFTNMWP